MMLLVCGGYAGGLTWSAVVVVAKFDRQGIFNWRSCRQFSSDGFRLRNERSLFCVCVSVCLCVVLGDGGKAAET